MHISSVPATVPVSSRLSPVMVWQQLLTYLLEHHYGLTLNDTPLRSILMRESRSPMRLIS